MMSTTPALLGQYRPADSYLHNLDARAKLVPILVAMVLALLTLSMVFYVVLILALVVGLKLSGIEFRSMGKSFAPILLLVLLTTAFHLIFSGRSSPVIAEPLGIPIRSAAVSMAAFYSLRLILFVVVACMITFTCSPSELAEALTRILGPLQRLRVPVNDLGLIVFIAIRFIPILYDEFVTIRNAQVMRGVDFTGSFVARIRKTGYLLIPVFVAAISRADDLALAIEARGYDSYAKRSSYSQARIGAKEIVFMATTMVLMCGLFFATVPHE